MAHSLTHSQKPQDVEDTAGHRASQPRTELPDDGERPARLERPSRVDVGETKITLIDLYY
jgi:hypothetical protein